MDAYLVASFPGIPLFLHVIEKSRKPGKKAKYLVLFSTAGIDFCFQFPVFIPQTSQVDYGFLIDVDFPSMMGPNVFYSIKVWSGC